VLFSPRLLYQILFRSNLACLHAAVRVVTHGGGFYDLLYAFFRVVLHGNIWRVPCLEAARLSNPSYVDYYPEGF
jgi:hypothetical protein